MISPGSWIFGRIPERDRGYYYPAVLLKYSRSRTPNRHFAIAAFCGDAKGGIDFRCCCRCATCERIARRWRYCASFYASCCAGRWRCSCHRCICTFFFFLLATSCCCFDGVASIDVLNRFRTAARHTSSVCPPLSLAVSV